LEPPLNETLKTLSHTFSGALAIPNLRRIHIQFSSSEKQFLLSLYSVGPLSFPLKRIYDALRSNLPLKGLIAYSSSGRQVLGLDFLFHQLGTFSFRAGDRTFVQIHWELNHLLVDLLLKWMSPLAGKKVLELYSGMGNFSLPLAQEGATVTGLDENPHAIQDAIQNAKQNQVESCRFQPANLYYGLPKKQDIPREVDALLVDPPREGLSKKLCQDILALAPPSIVYISCSPSTLARDLHLLTQNHFRIKRIQPVDLFPQTPHLEAIAHLERKG
jgi:23S rRNA (uracil1939-C5)-methyltransferase